MPPAADRNVRSQGPLSLLPESKVRVCRWPAGVSIAALLILSACCSGCRHAPITGRAQLMAIPEQEEIRLGEEAWREVLAGAQPSPHREHAQLVERVGRRLAAVSGRSDYQWEFKLLASEQANAFCLPGGKVAIYEGILPVCENEAGLAVVMSHEIAHALARHGGERMSQQAAVQTTGGLLNKATQRSSATTQERWRSAYGLTSQYGVLLPFSRQHEAEADSIGLTLMARAGYDPTEAPRFWERFAQASGPKPPEFLSTHPSDARRAAALRALLPQALAQYRGAPRQYGTGVAIVAPSPGGPASGGVQLAAFEQGVGERPSGPAVQPAAFAGEFVPPMQRSRRDEDPFQTPPSAAALTPHATAPRGGEPPPFPEASIPTDEGWGPAAVRP